MKSWLKRIRGALGMGVVWAAAWAVGGVAMAASTLLVPGLADTSFARTFDAPAPALAVPGFVAGVLFSIVLGIAARRRRFDELSLARFTALGAVGGLLLSVLPLVMVSIGLATPREGLNLWGLTAIIAGPFAVLSALSAWGTLILARRSERQPPGSLGTGEAEPIENSSAQVGAREPR
jgi:cytochrome bd-type quinol oxidase subunit 2